MLECTCHSNMDKYIGFIYCIFQDGIITSINIFEKRDNPSLDVDKFYLAQIIVPWCSTISNFS